MKVLVLVLRPDLDLGLESKVLAQDQDVMMIHWQGCIYLFMVSPMAHVYTDVSPFSCLFCASLFALTVLHCADAIVEITDNVSILVA